MEGMIVSHVFLGLGKPYFSYIEICISQILQAASTGLGKATGSRWRLRGRLRGLIMQEWRVNQRRKQLGGGAPRREGGGFRAKNEQLELVQNNIQLIHSTQILGESLCTCTLQIIFWCNIVLHNVV